MDVLELRELLTSLGLTDLTERQLTDMVAEVESAVKSPDWI